MKKTIYLLLITAISCGLASCSKHDTPFVSLKTYVIVPGAWSAPYAWANVKTDLEEDGLTLGVAQNGILPSFIQDGKTGFRGGAFDSCSLLVFDSREWMGGCRPQPEIAPPSADLFKRSLVDMRLILAGYTNSFGKTFEP